MVILQCRVEGVSHDGQGVARIQGLAVFIPGALPGEEVEIKMAQNKRRWARARLVRVMESAPERVEPPCPYYGRCGGCSYQHARYSLQLELKQQVVAQALRRIGKVAAEVKPVLGMENPWRYRNKVTWHGRSRKGITEMGFFQYASHSLLPVEDCLLVSTAMRDASIGAFELIRPLNEGQDRELTIRESSVDKNLMLVMSGFRRREAEDVAANLGGKADSVYWINQEKEILLSGKPHLKESLQNQVFNISPRAFFQVNKIQTEKLLAVLDDFLDLQGGENILDAYCGIGSLALGLASRAGRVLGIESFPGAVEDARNNARINGLDNCRFICGLCEEIMPGLEEKFDAVILDPPRSGCQPEVIRAVTRLTPSRIAYVSCEPSTLARDLSQFQEAGYLVQAVQPVDMFPQTRHVEAVVLMYLNGKR